MINFPKNLFCLCALAVSAVSCADKERSPYTMHPFVEGAAWDTSYAENRVLSSYESSRYGSIAIMGEGLETIRLANYLSVFDEYDNVDASSGPDGIPDFAGERFDVLIDHSNAPYSMYPDAGNTLFLRELLIRNAVSMMDGKCFANAYDKTGSEQKDPAKALVFSSVSYCPEIISDMDTLLALHGISVPAVYPPLSSVRSVLEDFKDISGVGVMAGIDVAASGIYGELFRDLSYRAGYAAPVPNVIFSPGDGTPADKIRNFIRMYIDAGYSEPLNAIIIDDILLAGSIDSMYVALKDMTAEKSEEGALYESVIADGFRFIDPAECTARELFKELRARNDMALRISYPKFSFYVSVFSPEFIMQSGVDSIGGALKFARAYDAGQNTVKIVRMTRRHIGSRERAVLDSLAPDIELDF